MDGVSMWTPVLDVYEGASAPGTGTAAPKNCRSARPGACAGFPHEGDSKHRTPISVPLTISGASCEADVVVAPEMSCTSILL